MSLGKSDLLLYFIQSAKVNQKKEKNYTKEQVAKALIMNPSSINYYLSQLSTQNYINRKKKHNIKYFLETVEVTTKGKNLVEDVILNELEKVQFTPERHYIDSYLTS